VAPDLFGLVEVIVVVVVVVDELPDDIGEAVLGELEEGAEICLPCCCGCVDGLLEGGGSGSGGHGGRSHQTSNRTRNMRHVDLGLGLLPVSAHHPNLLEAFYPCTNHKYSPEPLNTAHTATSKYLLPCTGPDIKF
jgi:hypothetical protein